MAVVKGSQTLWSVLNVDAGGNVLEASEIDIEDVTDVGEISSSDDVSTSAPLRPMGQTPIQEPFVTAIGYPTFDLTCRISEPGTSHARLVGARYRGGRVGIRLKRYDDQQRLVGTRTFLCIVTGFTESVSPSEQHQYTFSLGILVPEGPFLSIPIGPFYLAASGTQSVVLTDYFANADSFALGTLDPASNASASANYTASTMTLAITADASRTGTTMIPVTASRTGQTSASYTIVVVVS